MIRAVPRPSEAAAIVFRSIGQGEFRTRSFGASGLRGFSALISYAEPATEGASHKTSADVSRCPAAEDRPAPSRVLDRAAHTRRPAPRAADLLLATPRRLRLRFLLRGGRVHEHPRPPA